MKHFYILILALLLGGMNTYAATITSAASGNWTAATTWDGGTVPTATDDVVIASGTTVTINDNAIATTVASLQVNGILNFSSTAVNPFTIEGNLDVSGTFNAYNYNGTTYTGKQVVLRGNFTNTGTVDFSILASTGATAVFSGTSKQTISGTGNFGTFRSIAIDNAAGVDLKAPMNISGILYLTNGVFGNDANVLTIDNKIIGSSASSATTAEVRRTQVSSLANPIPAAVTAGALLNISYLNNANYAGAKIIEGNEIPAGRSINALTINNSTGVEINNDLLLGSSSSGTGLVLTAGIVTVAPGKALRFTNGAYLGTAGTATSFVDGAVSLTVGASNTRTWPIGAAGKNRKVVITGLARTGGTGTFEMRFYIEAGGSGTPGAGLTSLSTARRWVNAITPGTANFGSYTSISFDYFGDAANDGTNISAIASSNAVNGTYLANNGTATISAATNNAGASKLTSATGTYTAIEPYFALAATSGAVVLPVDLHSFKVTKELNSAAVSWVTGSEKNNDRFELQRAADGVNYAVIGSVKGKGDWSERTTYLLYDKNPLQGANYYRIAQYDRDGAEKIYDAKAISFQLNDKVAITVYPNPAVKGVSVNFNHISANSATLILSNLQGQKLLVKSLSDKELSNGYYLPLEQHIPKGTYLLTLAAGQLMQSIKVVKN